MTSLLSPPAGYDRARHGAHNLSRPETISDPTRYFQAIAELGPLFFDQVGRVWVCSGYAEASAVLSNDRIFSSARSRSVSDLRERGLGAASEVVDVLLRQMLFADGPEHTAVRSALAGQFTPAAVKASDQWLREIARGLVAALPDDGPVDLMTDLAAHLPGRLVAALLGMPGHDDLLRTWASAYETLLGSLSTLPAIQDQSVLPVLEEALGAFRQLAAERLQSAGPDLISQLVHSLATAGTLDRSDALDITAANCLVLVAGGYQTLSHLVCRSLTLLAGSPDQQDLLRSRPDLIDSMLAEVMRLDGSSQYVARRAREDTVLAGQRIESGQTVLVLLAAANLDPRKFTDPHRFDITRQQGRHLGFGHGRHYCIGAGYAERLAGWTVREVCERFEYRLPGGEAGISWGPHANTRCPAHVPAVLAARTRATPSLAGPRRPGPPKAPTRPADARAEYRPGGSLDARQEHLLVHQWNASERPLPAHRLWHHLVEEQAARTPQAVALDSDGTEVTYGELDRRANALAAELRRRGAEPEVVVTIMMERSAALIIAMLAVAKAGGAFMLVDPACPRQRLSLMVAEAAPRLILTDSATSADSIESVEVMVVDTSAEADEPPVSGAGPGTTAYIVFTSGTTGAPKAIAVSHEGMLNLQRAQADVLRLLPTDRVLQFLSLNFDGSIFEISLALFAGATLVLASGARLTVGPPLIRLLREQQISVVALTPSVWSALPGERLPSLRLAIACGERLTRQVTTKWTAPGRRFLNLYGPAETAIWASWHECQADEAGDPPIGRAVANKRLYLVDENLQLVPIGADGELCIGGIGVGRYLRRPELMDDRFRPDPFAPGSGWLLYRTGDVCRWRADGTLEYRGRRDRQVKVHGQRVELDEVERTLAAAPGVCSCAVAERDGRLAAIVVPGAGYSEPLVRRYLADRLHSAMVPSSYDAVDELPRTLNGKLDATTALAGVASAPGGGDDEAGLISVARPRGEPQDVTPASTAPPTVPQRLTDEQSPVRATPRKGDVSPTRWTWRVARHFSECLRAPQHRIKSDSDFFSIGGDSLAVAELVTRIEADSQITLDIEQLLQAPTPGQIAHAVAEQIGLGRG